MAHPYYSVYKRYHTTYIEEEYNVKIRYCCYLCYTIKYFSNWRVTYSVVTGFNDIFYSWLLTVPPTWQLGVSPKSGGPRLPVMATLPTPRWRMSSWLLPWTWETPPPLLAVSTRGTRAMWGWDSPLERGQ